MFKLAAIALAVGASAALAQEREWSFSAGEEQAYLVFGVPESDDAGIVFSCPIQSGEIEVFIVEGSGKLEPGKKSRFDFHVNGKTMSYEADVMPNEMSGIPSLRAILAPDDPFFRETVAADRFSFEVMGDGDTFPLAGADFVELLRVCRKAA